MPKGVKIEDLVIGNGAEARRGMTVAANVRIFLNRGDEVTAEYPQSPRTVIDLGRRDTIAGLRYGIEGMREGGRRVLIISPHLAYGAEGVGDFIPPHAVLRCEVELLEVGDRGAIASHTLPNKRQLHIFRPGIAAAGIPRCQISITEDGLVGGAVTCPLPGHGWRRTPMKFVELKSIAVPISELIDEALQFPQQAPDDCLSDDQLWSDQSEPSNGITRDRNTDTACVTVWVQHESERLAYYSIKIDQPTWLSSAMN
jgi:hypothetical protein